MNKIIGVTVGTPTSPKAMAKELQPVTSVNNTQPDETGNVALEVLPTVTKEDDGQFLRVVDGKWDKSPLPTYEGVYDVTPTVDGQILATENKLMGKDLRIKEIPITEVSNNSGGTTVTIG